MSETSLQERYAPKNACFGCGPANEKGLRIRSFLRGEEYVADWMPEKHHEAFDGMLNGGIIGTLLDCHMNWATAHHLMVQSGESTPPCTVTAEFSVKLLRPTPSDETIRISARIIESSEDRAEVESTIQAKGEVCAVGHGRFVAVKPGHPAYHRW
jgi:acyl-coenzyme A thioesterase PaaI-like protein